VQAGLKRGILFEATIRINPKRPTEAFAIVPNFKHDVLLDGLKTRNRALEGDRVIIALRPRHEWNPVQSELDKMADTHKGPEEHWVRAANVVFNHERKIPACLKAAQLPVPLECKPLHGEAYLRMASAADVAALEAAKLSMKGNGKELDLKLVGCSAAQAHLRTSAPPQHSRGQAGAAAAGAEGEPAPTPAEDWLQARGHVVAIEERNQYASRFVGTLELAAPGNKAPSGYALFHCVDARAPTMCLPVDSVPKEVMADPKSFGAVLFCVRVTGWAAAHPMPTCELDGCLGNAGEVGGETAALLAAHGVDSTPFSAEVVRSLPDVPYRISQEEIAKRRDLRGVRICSIDPTTAKDLDDALHITKLPDGNYEVGVHIADVSHFVKPGTAVDSEAQKRATTVYLCQYAVPMLPPTLCEDLCSLNPDVDRLAFSVIWKLTPEGRILDEWFGRTVICSQARLNYESAQLVIDAAAEGKSPPPFEAPFLPSPGVSEAAVVEDILNLHSIAQHLRRRRFENGSLSINLVKLAFKLDKDQNPVEVFAYRQREANRLVEEFMLLANQAVAQRIQRTFPDTSLLRLHPEPLDGKLDHLVEMCSELGLPPCDATSSKGIHMWLEACSTALDPLTFEGVKYAVAKPMQPAQYFATGNVAPEKWRHYALAMDQYTHFTSPIRRYPDVLVHRLLQAALDLEAMGEDADSSKVNVMGLHELTSLCQHCNMKKTQSKGAQEDSGKVFLCLLLKKQAMEEDAVVVSLGAKSFTLLVPKLGLERTVNDAEFDEKPATFVQTGKGATLSFECVWADGAKFTARMLAHARVRLTVDASRIPMQVVFTLLRPR